MRTFSRITLAAAVWCVAALAQVVDPYDALLTVYALNEAQVQEFAASAAAVTPFWSQAWNGRDYVDLNPGNNAVAGASFSGLDDARMIVKAAASAAVPH